MANVTAYIGIGSNLAQPREQVLRAFVAMHELPQTHCTALSGLYLSRAVGPGEQPDYVNAVARLQTRLTPLSLLDELQALEHRHNRVRTVHWGPRTLDLDILLYGDQVIDELRLQVPHPHLKYRSFVLAPLADLAADLLLPDGSRVSELLDGCDQQGLARYQAASPQAQIE